MKEKDLIDRFNQDLDIISVGQIPAGEGLPEEYREVLGLAAALKELDFSPDEVDRDRKRKQLINAYINGENKAHQRKVRLTAPRWLRPALAAGAAAMVLMLAVSIVFPGKITATANNAFERIIKTIHMGQYVTIIQVDDIQATVNAGENQGANSETVAKTDEDSEQPRANVVIYPTLKEAQKNACFKILVPKYLPDGYVFKEAEAYKAPKEAKASDEYINLYFKGPGKDIIIMERVLNENTQFVSGTNGEVEQVDINGSVGAWEAPHCVEWTKNDVSCSLFCSGFDKAEHLKIARSAEFMK